MKSTRNRITVILFCALMILAATLLAKNLGGGHDESKDGVDDKSMTSAISDESPAQSLPQDESSEESSEQPDESSAAASDEESSSQETPSTEEPSEESTDESSADDSSEEIPDKLSKKEKPVYIQKQEGVKYVAFTFDDGPSPNTEDLLNFIEEKNIKVTFFTVGNRVENYKPYGEYLTRAVSLGCEVGIHAYTHENYFDKCSEDIYNDELSKTADIIYRYAGYYPILMRPPGGSITKTRVANSEYNVIIWSVDSEDWIYKARTNSEQAQKNIQIIVNKIIQRVHASEDPIVLMHDLYMNSIEAFKIAAEQLIAEGYQFVTVAQLCNLDAATTVGKRYWNTTYLE